MADGDLTLKISGRSLSGWTQIRVTRGIEQCPPDFEISMTELYPGEAQSLVVQPFDQCQLLIGTDIVITGYVDRYAPGITASGHTIEVSGRGKCQDLVDCSAEWPGGQISGSSVLGIAQKLAQPYGITVAALDDVGGSIPQFNLCIGETAFEIIERICRYRALLAFEQADGSLALARVGTKSMASGFTEGQNVQAAKIIYAGDQRFSVYQCFLQSMDVLNDIGDGGNLRGTATDPNVPRNRKRYIVSEAGGGGLEVAQQRIKWDAARRAGRAQMVTITTDSWRDSAGKLWEPNQLVKVALPGLKLPSAQLCIGSVTFKRNENGTTADLVLMTPNSFMPEPVLLQPIPPDVPNLAGNIEAPPAAQSTEVLTPPRIQSDDPFAGFVPTDGR